MTTSIVKGFPPILLIGSLKPVGGHRYKCFVVAEPKTKTCGCCFMQSSQIGKCLRGDKTKFWTCLSSTERWSCSQKEHKRWSQIQHNCRRQWLRKQLSVALSGVYFRAGISCQATIRRKKKEFKNEVNGKRFPTFISGIKYREIFIFWRYARQKNVGKLFKNIQPHVA